MGVELLSRPAVPKKVVQTSQKLPKLQEIVENHVASKEFAGNRIDFLEEQPGDPGRHGDGTRDGELASHYALHSPSKFVHSNKRVLDL